MVLDVWAVGTCGVEWFACLQMIAAQLSVVVEEQQLSVALVYVLQVQDGVGVNLVGAVFVGELAFADNPQFTF